MATPKKSTFRNTLLENNVFVFEDPNDIKSFPQHIDDLRGVLLDFAHTIPDRYCIDEGSLMRDFDWNLHFKDRQATEEEENAVRKQVKKYQTWTEKAASYSEHLKSMEDEWRDFYRDTFLKQLENDTSVSNFDSRRNARSKYYYDSFRWSSSKYNWMLFEREKPLRKGRGLSRPVPDCAAYFTMHGQDESSNPRLKQVSNRWVWEKSPKQGLVKNFSRAVLEHLTHHGLEPSPGDALRKKRGKKEIDGYEYLCYPWLIVEHKKGDKSTAEQCYCQAANGAFAALQMYEILARYPQKANGRENLIFPIVTLTTVGKDVKAWLGYRDKTQYNIACIWVGDVTDFVQLIHFEALLENIHTWAMRELRPWISNHIDAWLEEFPLHPNLNLKPFTMDFDSETSLVLLESSEDEDSIDVSEDHTKTLRDIVRAENEHLFRKIEAVIKDHIKRPPTTETPEIQSTPEPRSRHQTPIKVREVEISTTETSSPQTPFQAEDGEPSMAETPRVSASGPDSVKSSPEITQITQALNQVLLSSPPEQPTHGLLASVEKSQEITFREVRLSLSETPTKSHGHSSLPGNGRQILPTRASGNSKSDNVGGSLFKDREIPTLTEPPVREDNILFTSAQDDRTSGFKNSHTLAPSEKQDAIFVFNTPSAKPATLTSRTPWLSSALFAPTVPPLSKDFPKDSPILSQSLLQSKGIFSESQKAPTWNFSHMQSTLEKVCDPSSPPTQQMPPKQKDWSPESRWTQTRPVYVSARNWDYELKPSTRTLDSESNLFKSSEKPSSSAKIPPTSVAIQVDLLPEVLETFDDRYYTLELEPPTPKSQPPSPSQEGGRRESTPIEPQTQSTVKVRRWRRFYGRRHLWFRHWTNVKPHSRNILTQSPESYPKEANNDWMSDSGDSEISSKDRSIDEGLPPSPSFEKLWELLKEMK